MKELNRSHTDEIKLKMELCKTLRREIEKGNIEKVRDLLKSSQGDEYFYDDAMESIAAFAVKNKRINIYDFLLSQGITLGPNELMEKLVVGQPLRQKRRLLEVHRKHFKSTVIEHLEALKSKSKLSHDAPMINRRQYLEAIAVAFDDLNTLKSIQPILKVASTVKILQIVFDFNQESLVNLDPTKSQYVFGATYSAIPHIYIGAKGLLVKGENRYKALGVIAHELCHFAMNLVYNNDCKPFYDGDRVKAKEFEKVLIATREAIKTVTAEGRIPEECITKVFDRDKAYHDSELIARVPHLLALYMDDDDKYNETSKEFRELFNFYQTNTFVDLEREYRLMEAKQKLIDSCATLRDLKTSEIDMKPYDFDVTIDLTAKAEIIILSSNCCKLIMYAIYQYWNSDENFESSFIFADSDVIKNDKVFAFAVKSLKLCIAPTLIIECDDIKEADNIKTKFIEHQIKRNVICVCQKSCNSLNVPTLDITYTWSDLTSNFQQKLLQHKINFQGNEMRFEELIKERYLMESIPLRDLIDRRLLQIGGNVMFPNFKEFIERKFLLPNSELVFENFSNRTGHFSLLTEDYDFEYSFSDISFIASQQKTILLSDEPGMGKSTSFKMIQSSLIKKDPSFWVVLMDLKDHCKAFQLDKMLTYEFINSKEITKFFCEKILKIESFEAQVFAQLFKDNRVILLMDGLDEILPAYKLFMIRLLTSIQKYSENQLWISTRPHLEAEMKQILNALVFKLKPLTKHDRKNFFMNFFAEHEAEQKIAEIEDFLLELNRGSQSSGNPLLMKMIAEILHGDEDFNLPEANLYLIYNQFTRKLFENSMEKGPEARKSIASALVSSNIDAFYEKIALEIIYDPSDIKSFTAFSEILDLSFHQVAIPPFNDTIRVGLLYSDDSESFQFIHRTFAEFYVAKFFYDKIFLRNFMSDEELDGIVEVFVEAFNAGSISKITENFLDHAFVTFATDKTLTCSRFLKVKKAIEKYLDFTFLEKIISGGSITLFKNLALLFSPNIKDILITRNKEGKNLVMIAAEHLTHYSLELFFEILDQKINQSCIKNMFLESDSEVKSIFHYAAINKHIKVFGFLKNKAEILIKDHFAEKLMQQDKAGWTIFHVAIRKNDHKINEIISKISELLSKPQLEIFLCKKNGDTENVWHLAALTTNLEVIESLWTCTKNYCNPEKLKEILMEKDKHGLVALQIAMAAIGENDEVYDFIEKAYLETLGADKLRTFLVSTVMETKLFMMRRSMYDETVARMSSLLKELLKIGDNSDLKKLLLHTNNDGDTALMYMARKGYYDILNLLSLFELLNTKDKIEILLHRNDFGECAYHCAIYNENSESFQEVQTLYKDCFDDQKMSEIVCKRYEF